MTRLVPLLLAFYPRRWRERHGAELEQLLLDTIAGGRGGVPMALDVAREGLAERVRALRWRRMAGGALIGTGWKMFFPQGVVAAILSQTGVPAGWFVALHLDGQEQFLVAGGMAIAGLVLVDRGIRLMSSCPPRRYVSRG